MRLNLIAAAVAAATVCAVGLATPATARPADYDPARFMAWAEYQMASGGGNWSAAKIRKQADKVCSHGKGYAATLQDKGLSASFARQFAAKAKSDYCPPSTSKPSSSGGAGDALALG